MIRRRKVSNSRKISTNFDYAVLDTADISTKISRTITSCKSFQKLL
jgi:hypothetical protein